MKPSEPREPEAFLRRFRLAEPRPELRARVLDACRPRQRPWFLAAAAAMLVALVFVNAWLDERVRRTVHPTSAVDEFADRPADGLAIEARRRPRFVVIRRSDIAARDRMRSILPASGESS